LILGVCRVAALYISAKAVLLINRIPKGQEDRGDRREEEIRNTKHEIRNNIKAQMLESTKRLDTD
jgi:hypothetical protein